MLASAELREQNRQSHIRTPVDAKRLADFLAKIEAHETVLLQRQRDIENQVVVYRVEQRSPGAVNPAQTGDLSKMDTPLSNEALPPRFPDLDLTNLQVYEEFR